MLGGLLTSRPSPARPPLLSLTKPLELLVVVDIDLRSDVVGVVVPIDVVFVALPADVVVVVVRPVVVGVVLRSDGGGSPAVGPAPRAVYRKST